MQDFDKKLTETDSYLQILIDQVKVNPYHHKLFLKKSVDKKYFYRL